MAITKTFNPPLPSDTPDVFSQKAFQVVADLNAWSAEANTLAGEVNQDEGNAAASAASAAASATTATTKAGAAASSAAAAATSASTATTKAGEAATSATSAAGSAASANTKASEAAASAANAAASATTAGTKASEAAASAATAGSAATTAINSIASALPTIRPTLLLDFANSKTVDPRITFTRASSASYYGADGILKYAASGVPRGADHDPVTGVCKGLLVEGQRTNLLTYSEQFDNVAWVKYFSSITPDAATAPDGAACADMLAENTDTNVHYCSRNFSFSAGATLNASVYVKQAPGPARHVRIQVGTSDGFRAYFDLTSGTVASAAGVGTGTAVAGSATIQPVGNGWYRCSVAGTCAPADTTVGMMLYLQNNPAASASYAGDGSSGIYIWGAQVEAGSLPTSYIPSTDTFTSRASTATFIGSNGLIQTAAANVARYQYNPLNLTLAPKLLLEEQRTNLLTYSEDFVNAVWDKSSATITANTSAAPDGTLTADTITITAFGGGVYESATVTAGTVYVGSVYVGAGTNTLNTLRFAFYDNTAGAFISMDVVPVAAETANGMTRYWAAVTPPAGCSSMRFYPCRSSSVSSGSYALWGAQLEAIPAGSGAYASSYIPTTTTAVTRVADQSTSAQTTKAVETAPITGANFSAFYRRDAFSKVCGFYANASGTRTIWSINDGTANNRITLRTVSGALQLVVTVSGVDSTLALGSITSGQYYNVAAAWAAGSVAASVNGATPVTASPATMPTVSQMNIGSNAAGADTLTSAVARFAGYPKRVSNTELQALSAQ